MAVGAQVTIGPGVRIHDAIILEHVVIKDHTLVMHSIGNIFEVVDFPAGNHLIHSN